MAEELTQQAQVQTDPPSSKKLWETLSGGGLYTKDYNSFVDKYSSPESIGELYKKLHAGGLYTKSEEDFNSKYFTVAEQDVPTPKNVIEDPIEDVASSVDTEPDTMDDLLQALEVVPAADPLVTVPDPDFPDQGVVAQDVAPGQVSGERVLTEGELEENRAAIAKVEEERLTFNKIATDALAKLPERPKGTIGRKGEGIEVKKSSQMGFLGADVGIKFTQQERILNQTHDILEKIAGMSEKEAPGFFSGLGSRGAELIPFLGTLTEIPKLLDQKGVLDKPQNERTESEQMMVDAIALLNSFEASGHKPTSYEYGEMVGMMIPFLGEFAATGGVATSVAKSVGKELLKAGVKRGALNYTVRGTAGAIAQATANPQRYVEGTITRMTPIDQAIINFDDKEIEEIVRVKEGEGIAEAATKAYLTQVSEMLTERLGFAYGAGAKKFMASNVAKKLVDEKVLAKYTLSQFAKKNGIESASELKKFTDRIGFQGVLTEVWGEELPNMALNEIITGDSGKSLLESLNPLDKDLLNMVIPILILQGAIHAPSTAVSAIKVIKEVSTKKEVDAVTEKPVKQPEKPIAEPAKDIKKEKEVPGAKGISEQVAPKEEVDVSQEERVDIQQKTEGETTPPASKKAELEKKIEKTATSKKSDYIKRRLKDVNDTPVFKKEVEKLGDYTPQDRELAATESESLIREFQKEYGEAKGLTEAIKLVKSKDIPELMLGPITAKLDIKLRKAGMEQEAVDLLDYKQKTLRESARAISSVASDSSPEETVSRLFAGLEQRKTSQLETELKEGQTFGQAYTEIKTKLSELETAYKELAEKGTVKGDILPEVTDTKAKTKRSRELKERGRSLRKEGFAQLDKYFKAQKGTLSMGLRVDNDLIGGLAKVFRGYLLEFEGNARAAFEKFKKDTSAKYEITAAQLEEVKTNILAQSKETIEEFKQEKQRQVVDNLLKPSGKETTEERKLRKEMAADIVEAHNEGKSDAEVLNLFSGVAKFEKLSEQDTKEILDLMESQSKLLFEGKGELAKNKWIDLMYKLGDVGLVKRSFTDTIQDFWYTFVLSGLTTVVRSIKGSGISSFMFTTSRLIANPKVAPFAVAQMIRGARGNTKAYINVLKTGETDFTMADFNPKSPQFTKEIANRPFRELSGPKKAAKIVLSPVIYMFRNIPAFDQVLGNVASEGNIAIAEFNRTSKEKKISERIKEVKVALAKGREKQIRELVDTEMSEMRTDGETVPIGYKERRFRAIRNEYRDRDAVRKALEDSKIGAFVSTPKGTLGFVYNAWINAAEIKNEDPGAIKTGKLMLKGVFPFIRIFFNWLNAGVEYTPLGAVRAVFKPNRWTKDGVERMTDYERRELIVRSALGFGVGASIFSSMFDWDDETGFKLKDEDDMWIQVHGPLTGEWYETDAVNSGAKPWSFRVKIYGEWSDYYFYRDNTIGLILAPIGILHDEIKFKEFQKNKAKKSDEIVVNEIDMQYLMGAWAEGTFRYAADQSFNQGMKTLSEVMTGGGRKSAFEKVSELITRPAEALVYPSLYKQTYNYYKAYQGIPEKQDQSWLEHTYKSIPIVDGLIKNDAYDVFGYPIVRKFDVPGIPDFLLEMAKDNLSYREELKEWQLLWKYEEVVLGGFVAPDIYKGHKLTSEEKDEYMRVAGENMRSRLMDPNTKSVYTFLDKMAPAALQKKLNSYKTKSRTFALKNITK